MLKVSPTHLYLDLLKQIRHSFDPRLIHVLFSSPFPLSSSIFIPSHFYSILFLCPLFLLIFSFAPSLLFLSPLSPPSPPASIAPTGPQRFPRPASGNVGNRSSLPLLGNQEEDRLGSPIQSGGVELAP